MKKIKFEGLDVDLYYEKMPNGLSVYVIPNDQVATNFAVFSTKYGNRINEFIPVGSKELKKYPAGIAHFLEHKVFEQKDGIDPFAFFSSHGADCNAFTNTDMTCYYFDGMDHFKENLEYLIDFVQEIYLTDENVEKEKGIIIEEANMGLDNLSRQMYHAMNELVFKCDPRRFKVIGEIDEIKSITREELLECYNTFYHPSNMNLIVSGNVDYKEVFKIVKNNQAKKNYKPIDYPEVRKVEEPKELAKKEIVIKGNTSLPYLGYVIKLDLRNLDCDFFTKVTMLNGILYSLLSTSMGFSEMLCEKQIISGKVSRMTSFDNDFCIINVTAKTNKIDEYFTEIEKHFQNFVPDKETFERYKKVVISDYIGDSDDPYSMAHNVRSDLYFTGEVGNQDFVKLKALTFDEFKDFVNKINFKESGKIIINPKDAN